jgi:alkylation response protein AidB-like acyl-CoA dehydrogenase
LPKLAAGELIGTLALSEGPRVANPDTIELTFEGGKLNGTKTPVPDGDIANIAIVAAKSGGSVSLVLVDLAGDGVSRETLRTLDPSRSHANVTFKDAPATVLGEGGNWDILLHVLDRAAVLIAFEQIGGADTCMRMAREYSIGRYAFGRPIGSFQALKHRMAEMYVKNELARSNAYYGAWALSTDAPELAVAAASARISATEAYHFASKENIQIHGGMGFTWEADCHFFYRRSKLLSLCLGSARLWKDRLVSGLEVQQGT